jgi:DNA-binding NarL/FixJ family response regulator
MLSPREREVVEHVAAGASNPEIAGQLFISRRTVESHVASAMRKLGAANRTQLATFVARRGS